MPSVNCMRVLHRQLQVVGTVLVLLLASSWSADEAREVAQRIEASAKAFTELMSDPRNAIPSNVLEGAKCVAVIPSMVQVAVALGGNHGKGFVTCRSTNGWSAPAPITITGVSWGSQIGGEAVDLVMVVTNGQGMQRLLSSQMKFGTEASVAAGPVGLHAGTGSDATMKAEVLTYSRARGLFAGTNLNGASVSQDQDDTRALYGSDISFAQILSGKIPAPEASQPFVEAVEKYAAQANNPAR
jgi:SH3 domain-containing YSC84-like protein 1